MTLPDFSTIDPLHGIPHYVIFKDGKRFWFSSFKVFRNSYIIFMKKGKNVKIYKTMDRGRSWVKIRIAGLDKVNFYKSLENENLQLKEQVRNLRAAIKDLLIAADATWEDRDEGHDWAEVCEQVRQLLDINK